MQTNTALYLRTIIFGVNDSLVSTVGFLAGISVAGVPRATIILTGLVYASVEAFSMAMGNYLSEESAREYLERKTIIGSGPAIAGVMMFFASILAALIPLAPYLLFGGGQALAISVTASFIGLFITGALSARFSRLPAFSRGVRMALLGGLAIVIGIVVGRLAPPV